MCVRALKKEINHETIYSVTIITDSHKIEYLNLIYLRMQTMACNDQQKDDHSSQTYVLRFLIDHHLLLHILYVTVETSINENFTL